MYNSIKDRRYTNDINEIQTNVGPISSPSIIMEEFCKYFNTLYNSHSTCLPYDIPLKLRLNSIQVSSIEEEVSYQKIIDALHSINVNKSLGLNDFNSNLFIAC